MMRRLALAALIVLACGACMASAQGLGNCSLTITNLSFGTYNGTLLTGVTPGTVRCNTFWDIPLDAGMGAGATETIRKMTAPGGATLNYQLFQDSARTINWGNYISTDLSGFGNASITVYGQIPAGQVIVPGIYTDTVHSTTTSFTITVLIQPNCTISANTLNFGTFSGSQIDASTLLTATCTNTTTFDIGLNAGTVTGATVTTRGMTGPTANKLNYSMFRDSARALNWGNTVGTDTLHETGSGTAVQYNIYGRIPAGQFVAPGTYTDTIIATITY